MKFKFETATTFNHGKVWAVYYDGHWYEAIKPIDILRRLIHVPTQHPPIGL